MSHNPSASDRLIEAIDCYDRESFANDEDRNAALLASYRLVSRLETPRETATRIALTQPAVAACLKTARDLRLFEIWHDRGPQTSEQLAEWVHCDKLLLRRLLCHLVANNLLEQSDGRLFSQTPFTIATLQPHVGEWINYQYEATIPCFYKMPKFLEETGYTNPSDPHKCAFQSAMNVQESLFEYYETHPKESKTFNLVMGDVITESSSLTDIYPTEKLLNNGYEPLLVDIGGNIGRDIERFRALHPHTAQRLILQDRPNVIRTAICGDKVQRMAHNFFDPQPVKGARVYYMRGVLHDWPDAEAVKILRQLKPAMDRSTSKLLVHDHVLSEDYCHNPQTTAYDLTMMVKIAGLERSEAMWRSLMDQAGFRIVKIWPSSTLAAQSVIEAEPIEDGV